MLHTFWHHFRLWLIPFRFLVSESCAQTGKGPKASTLARAKACLFFSEVLITFACRGAPEVKACHVQDSRDSFIMFYPPTRSSLHSACPKSLSWFEDGRIVWRWFEMQLKWPPGSSSWALPYSIWEFEGLTALDSGCRTPRRFETGWLSICPSYVRRTSESCEMRTLQPDFHAQSTASTAYFGQIHCWSGFQEILWCPGMAQSWAFSVSLQQIRFWQHCHGSWRGKAPVQIDAENDTFF